MITRGKALLHLLGAAAFVLDVMWCYQAWTPAGHVLWAFGSIFWFVESLGFLCMFPTQKGTTRRIRKLYLDAGLDVPEWVK